MRSKEFIHVTSTHYFIDLKGVECDIYRQITFIICQTDECEWKISTSPWKAMYK